MKEKNTFCWIDIPVANLDRAIAFYTAILGENVQKVAEHGFTFGLLPHTENNVSGCLVEMEDRKPSQDGVLVYLNVEGQLDKAIAQTSAHGGKVLKVKEQIGSYGHRAVILDTEGNAVALYSMEA
jgi:uncharacterized protein